jgi:predicted RNase H-like HicB family nuclease
LSIGVTRVQGYGGPYRPGHEAGLEGGNFSAFAPDLPGVVAASESEEESTKLIEEAIELHIAGSKKG